MVIFLYLFQVAVQEVVEAITHHGWEKVRNMMRDLVFLVQKVLLDKVLTLTHFLKKELSWWESPN